MFGFLRCLLVLKTPNTSWYSSASVGCGRLHSFHQCKFPCCAYARVCSLCWTYATIYSEGSSRSLCHSNLLGAFTKLCKVTVSFIISVRLSTWNNLAPTVQFSMQFVIWLFFENLSRKFKSKVGHEDQYKFFFIIFCLILRKKNVLDKSCRENQTSHFMLRNFFLKTMPFVR